MGDYAEWEVEDSISRGDWYEKPIYCISKADNPNYGKDHLKGIENWLNNKYLSGAGKDGAYETRNQRIIERFYKQEINKPVPVNKPYSRMAKEISTDHWVPFMKWVKETYK